MNGIYVMQAGARIGPLAEEELKNRFLNGKVGAGELVWYDGLDKWVPMGEVATKNNWSVPKLPPAPPPAINKEFIAMNCRECGFTGQMPVKSRKVPWWTSWWLVIAVFLIVVLVAGPVSTPVAVIAGVGLYIMRNHYTKAIVDCPNCSKTLKQL